MDRYARQRIFPPIGTSGQERLRAGKAAIIGVGALGGVMAESLCRSGIGALRFADTDVVEESNLHRQVLYSENDARSGFSKVEAAKNRLSAINSNVRLEPWDAKVTASNIEAFVNGMDVVLDATDNLESRYIINSGCLTASKPWIYSGVLGSRGMTMNILPEGPCFYCLAGPLTGSYPTTAQEGVVNMVTLVIASYAAAEAVKILLGDCNVRRTMLVIDMWNNETEYINIQRDSDCPACGAKNR